MKSTNTSSVFDPGPEITSWCEVNAAALKSNAAALRQRLQTGTLLGVVVKSEAYGHGMLSCARAFLRAGADWLVVNTIQEAVTLREAGIEAPVYVCGRVFPAQAPLIIRSRARVVLYDLASARAFAAAGREAGKPVGVHLKVETGMHRQGLALEEAVGLARRVQNLKGLVLEGLSTHYADMDVPTDHTFAMQQLDLLHKAHCRLRQSGINIPIVHSANSAATILWPQTHASLVRTGIAAYGLWPSEATRTTALQRYADGEDGWQLEPALSWRARVAQVKEVSAGAYIGYGRTFQAAHPMRVAVLPLGYYEGYDRRLSNRAHVLINGARARVCGRVSMNMTVVDVSQIPAVQVGTVATLLGRDGEEEVSADMLASWIGTINYEVVSRIHPGQPRFVLEPEDGM